MKEINKLTQPDVSAYAIEVKMPQEAQENDFLSRPETGDHSTYIDSGLEAILSQDEVLSSEAEHEKSEREAQDLLIRELTRKANVQAREIEELRSALNDISENSEGEDHIISHTAARTHNANDQERNGGDDGGKGDRTPSGFNINEPIRVIIDRYSDTALEQKKQVMMEVADYLVRNLSEEMEGIAEKSHEKFMDEYGKLSLENQQMLIEGLQAANATWKDMLDAAQGPPKTSLDNLQEFIDRTDSKKEPDIEHAVDHLLHKDGHLALSIRNIANILDQGGEEEKKLAQEQLNWLEDLGSEYSKGNITPSDAYTQIHNHLPALEELHNNIPKGLFNSATNEPAARSRQRELETFRRQEITSIVDIAEGIAQNNPDFAEGGDFPILVTEKDENGEPVMGTRVVRDRRGEAVLDENGNERLEEVEVRRLNEENFLRWVRDRMIYLHNEDPDNPGVNFFGITVDLPQFFRPYSLQQMIRDPGRYFKYADWEKDQKTGEWKEAEPTILNNLKDEATRHAWLFGGMRTMYITYLQAMPMDTKIGETLMNIYQNNTLTKVADEGRSPLYWILTIPEHFKENEANDMNVGEAIRTTLLTYRSLTDYPELERIWGKDSPLFKKETIFDTIQGFMKEEKRLPETHFLNPHRIKEINSWFDGNGNLKRENGKVPVKIQQDFTDFLNIFSPENVANETKIVQGMIKKALEKKYGFEGAGGKVDDQSLLFAEMYALFMSRPMLFGGRNDRGAAAMDASAKTLRMGQNRSRKYSETSAGSSGNPFDSVLLEAGSVDFLESVQTTSSSLRKRHINILDDQNIRYTGKDGIPHRLNRNEEIIEIPQGFELKEENGRKTVEKINYELGDRKDMNEDEVIETYVHTGIDKSGKEEKKKKYRIRNTATNAIVEDNLSTKEWQVSRYKSTQNEEGEEIKGKQYLFRPDYTKLTGEGIVTGKVVVKRGTNEVIREVDKKSALQVSAEKRGKEDGVQDGYIDASDNDAGDAKYVVYEVKFDENGKRVLVENTFHHETILDVLEMMEEARKRGATQRELLGIASRLSFKEDATRQLTSNQYNRAFQIFLMLNDAEELEIASYAEFSPQKGVTVSKKQLQNDFTERFIKPLRYAMRTWADLDFSRIVRAPDPDTEYKDYKYMHLAEAIFGKQVIEQFRSEKEGIIDWDYFDTSDGKAALFKTYSALYIAAQIWNHRNRKSTAPWLTDEEVEAYLEVLHEVPGKIGVNRDDFKHTNITGHFYGDFKINRFGDTKNYMKIIREASNTGYWKMLRNSIILDLLEALVKGGAEALLEASKTAVNE